MDFLPYGRQSIDDQDIEAVTRVMKSDWLTTGPEVERFEVELAAYCGSRYAVACSSGTAALHLACLALGLAPGDAVVTSPMTFLATANCARYVGADVVFSDISPETSNLDPLILERTLQKKGQKNFKAIFPIHFAGHPAPMAKIHEIAKKSNLKIVEDACHALGAKYQDTDGTWIRIGSCRHSDMTVFSFHPVKHITTGEGGAITTNDENLYQALKRFRSHGMVHQSRNNAGEETPWFYEMETPGFNYRLTDIQSALGRSQLAKLPGYIKRRREIASDYEKKLRTLFGQTIQLPLELSGAEHAYHLYCVKIDFKALGIKRGSLMKLLKENGIGTQVHYIPVHLQPYYRRLYKTKPGDFPQAETHYEQCLSLPMYPGLPEDGVSRVVKALEKGHLSGVR